MPLRARYLNRSSGILSSCGLLPSKSGEEKQLEGVEAAFYVCTAQALENRVGQS